MTHCIGVGHGITVTYIFAPAVCTVTMLSFFFFPLDPTVLKMTCAIEIVYNNNTIAYDSNICHMCERNISP